ncbi:MAG TPA: Bax inhibitor-1/YccA family protein [Gemmatimonadales bacterium]|nr:Bax inhibitor-1/YccA family protein [Gemmatimonadales bacterium]
MKTTNPALSSKILEQLGRTGQLQAGEAMTVEGAINKTALLTFLVIVPAAWIWSEVVRAQSLETVVPWMVGGVIGGLIAAMVTIFKKEWAPVTAPIYAVLEGLAIGGVSAMLNMQYHGIVIQAVALTFATLACMLIAYRTGLIKVTDRFRMMVVAATGAIALLYLVTMLLSFFHVTVPFVFGTGGTGGIVLSLVIVGVAALNLALDFDFIEQAAGIGAPKYVEWYAAFGLMVTLIWLYMEILRLLGQLRRR